MHFITEQDLQVRHREQALEHLCLGEAERLTPGARQYLNDHQIKIIDQVTPINKHTQSFCDNEDIVSEQKLKQAFLLLELELQEAALKANEVDLASSSRIAGLSELPRKIEQNINDAQLEQPALNEIEGETFTMTQLLTPHGKIVLKLKRSEVFAADLQERVTAEQREQLAALIQSIRREIDLLIGEIE